jgi:hypothetical protein
MTRGGVNTLGDVEPTNPANSSGSAVLGASPESTEGIDLTTGRELVGAERCRGTLGLFAGLATAHPRSRAGRGDDTEGGEGGLQLRPEVLQGLAAGL